MLLEDCRIAWLRALSHERLYSGKTIEAYGRDVDFNGERARITLIIDNTALSPRFWGGGRLGFNDRMTAPPAPKSVNQRQRPPPSARPISAMATAAYPHA